MGKLHGYNAPFLTRKACNCRSAFNRRDGKPETVWMRKNAALIFINEKSRYRDMRRTRPLAKFLGSKITAAIIDLLLHDADARPYNPVHAGRWVEAA
jgi:hypothetical protein